MSEKKPKVLFLPAWYPNKSDIMSGLFVKYHALSIKPYADVCIMAVLPTADYQYKCIQSMYFIDEGVPTIITYIYKRDGHFFDRLLYFPRYIRANFKAYKLVKKFFGTPDINHVHILTRSGLWALWKKITKGTPYVITEHWSRYLPQNAISYKGALRKWLTKKVAKNADAITTVSQHLGKAMQNKGLKNAHYSVVNNVVNTDFFKPSDQKIQNDKKIILHVSCFDERPKNVKGIIAAINLLKSHRNDFVLRLVGDGKDKTMVKEYAHSLGLMDEVIFTGLKTGAELLAEYQNADIFLLFSNFENQPVVLLESFACGLPVIATTVGGIPEIVKDGFGILVPPGDVKELSHILDNFLENKYVFKTDEMRAYAIENFSYPSVGQKFSDIYRSILQKK